jgi:hypothetical protein
MKQKFLNLFWNAGDHAKYFLICYPCMAGSFTSTSGIMKKIVILLVHVKIYAREARFWQFVKLNLKVELYEW